ncbi:MAG TPA: SDR family oxidoreductase [Pseudonocardia sp.]|nr:SDR family oxidoreductase [Pseudonocardia sp.]
MAARAERHGGPGRVGGGPRHQPDRGRHADLRAVAAMLARRWGRVVNVSSGVAARPGFMVGGNAYTTAKAALEAHTLNLAAELADTGVTVNVSDPARDSDRRRSTLINTDRHRRP